MLTLSELDVSRDILDLKFVSKSEDDDLQADFYLHLISWTELDMELFVNFTDPSVVSTGP